MPSTAVVPSVPVFPNKPVPVGVPKAVAVPNPAGFAPKRPPAVLVDALNGLVPKPPVVFPKLNPV